MQKVSLISLTHNINKEFTPGMDKFIELYQEKYNGHPKSGHSLASYMGMKVVLDVITQTGGDVDPEKLHKLLWTIKLKEVRQQQDGALNSIQTQVKIC